MIAHPNRSTSRPRKPVTEITRDVAERVLKVVNAGLVRGLGDAKPGSMCVEAAVCYAMGLPHGDKPSCVSPALRSLKIRLNDSNWSSDEARTNGLRRLALAQLGSAGFLDESEFIKRVLGAVIRKMFPPAFRAVAAVQKNEAKKAQWSDLASRCEAAPEQMTASEARQYFLELKQNARSAAADAAYAAAAAADAAYAYAAAYAAAYAYAAADAAYAAAYAADAAYAAADAAYAAAAAAAYAYAAAYAAADAAYAAADAAYAKKEVKQKIEKARDRSLSGFCEEVVQILIAMKVPGVEWLDLAPLEQAA